MKIIAKTDNGFIIEASEQDVREILSGVSGKENIKKEEIQIGQKIPALDYSSSIRKVKSLKNNAYLDSLRLSLDRFNKSFESLDKSITDASEIEI